VQLTFCAAVVYVGKWGHIITADDFERKKVLPSCFLFVFVFILFSKRVCLLAEQIISLLVD
jgi:hypothetical protein